MNSDDSSLEGTDSVTVVVHREDSDDECLLKDSVQKMPKSLSFSDARIDESKQRSMPEMSALSKSLGAKAFDDDINSGDEHFEDAENDDKSSVGSQSKLRPSGKVYVSAAISIPYSGVPPSTKFTRYVRCEM